MKKYYTLSRIIMFILTIITSLITFHNEDISVIQVATTLFVVVALITSFLATPISKKMICLGDTVSNRYLRILYYIVLLAVILMLAFLAVLLIMAMSDNREFSNELGAAAGQAMLIALLVIAVFVMLIVPYIQTLIVLLLRRLIKDKGTDEG